MRHFEVTFWVDELINSDIITINNLWLLASIEELPQIILYCDDCDQEIEIYNNKFLRIDSDPHYYCSQCEILYCKECVKSFNCNHIICTKCQQYKPDCSICGNVTFKSSY